MAEPVPLSDQEVADRLGSLPGWKHEAGEIYKWFRFGGFPEAVEFLVRMVEPAERMHHHPDLEVHERRVRVGLHTWSVEAITERDFALAAEIERAAAQGG